MALWKSIAVGVASFGAGALALWGAFALEETSASHRVVRSKVEGDAFVVEVAEKPRGVVVIHCDEEEIAGAFALFREHLGIREDPYAFPGGPRLLAMAPASVPSLLAPAKRAVVEVWRRHAPARYVLIAHANCVYDDAITAWQDRRDQTRAKQIDAMSAAAKLLATWNPGTPIERYYCDVEPGDAPEKTRLRFTRLP